MNLELSSHSLSDNKEIQKWLNDAKEQPRSTPDQLLKIIHGLGKVFSSIQNSCVARQPGCELALSGIFASNWQSFLSSDTFQTPSQRYYFVHQFLQNFSPEIFCFSCGLLEALLTQPTILDPTMRPLSQMLVPLFWSKDWTAINSLMELYQEEANEQELNIWLLACLFNKPCRLNSLNEMKEFIHRLPAYIPLHTDELYLEQLVQMRTNEFEQAVAAFSPEGPSKIKLCMAYLILFKNKSLKKIPQSIFLINSIYENSIKQMTIRKKAKVDVKSQQSSPLIHYFESILNGANKLFNHDEFCRYLKRFEDAVAPLQNIWLQAASFLKENAGNPNLPACFQFIEESVQRQVQSECYLSITLLMFACRTHLSETDFFKKGLAHDSDTVSLFFQGKWALASIYLEGQKASQKNMRSFEIWLFCQTQSQKWLQQFKKSKMHGKLLINFAKDNPTLEQEITQIEKLVLAFLNDVTAPLPHQLNFLKAATFCTREAIQGFRLDPLIYPLWLKNLMRHLASKADFIQKNSYLGAIQSVIASYEGTSEDVLTRKREGDPLSSLLIKKTSI